MTEDERLHRKLDPLGDGDPPPGGQSPPDVRTPDPDEERSGEDLDPRDPESAGNEDLRTPGED